MAEWLKALLLVAAIGLVIAYVVVCDEIAQRNHRRCNLCGEPPYIGHAPGCARG